MDFKKSLENPPGHQRLDFRNKNNEETQLELEDELHSMSTTASARVKKMKVVDYLVTSFFPSISSASDQDIIKIGNTFFILKGRLLIPKDEMLFGRNVNTGRQLLPSYQWNTKSPYPHQLPEPDMAPYESGTIGAAREVNTVLEAFEVFFTENMLETILANTNDEIKIAQYYIAPKSNYVHPLSLTELKAFIGILFLFGLKKNNKLSSSFLWDICDSDTYKTVISKERFDYLTQCLRFDEFTTRNEREKRDSFSNIRGIWDDFFSKCSEVFRPSMNCTIGEIFIDFNGKCPFKLPLPREPQKNGIQLILLSDSSNRYVISAIPCLDKNNNSESSLAENVVEKLTKPIRGTNINITYANDVFNSIPLSKRLLKLYKLTSVGALHKNHIEIPPDIVLSENRPKDSIICIYNVEDRLQLYTHCPEIGQINTYLSSKQFESVNEKTEVNPEVVEYYNSTKESVNIIKKICFSNTCSRPTKNWFVAIFYTILDLAAINSSTILNLNRAKCGKRHFRHVDFVYKLSLDLILPYMKERLNEPGINNVTKNKIISVEEERLKLNVELNPPKYTLEEIKAMYPPTQSTKSAKNTRVSSNILVQPIVTELETKKSSKLNLLTTSVSYPHIENAETIATTISQEDNLTTLGGRQNQEMSLPIHNNMSVNSDSFSGTIIPKIIQPRYTVEQSESLFPFPSMQPKTNILATYQDFENTSRDILLQELQKICASLQPATITTPSVSTQTNRSHNLLVEILKQPNSAVATISSEQSVRNMYIPNAFFCGVCYRIGEQNSFEQCYKCGIIVCKLHQNVLCTNCFIKQMTEPRFYAGFLNLDTCPICQLSRRKLFFYVARCYKCLAFLCPNHRQMLCCICIEG